MFDAIINKQGDLLIVHFSGTVDREQTRASVELVRSLMPKVQPGFSVVTDMGRLTHMDYECADDIGQLMDLFNKGKIARVYRVMPNPELDIGWNILSKFHYDREVVSIRTYPSFFWVIKDLNQEEK